MTTEIQHQRQDALLAKLVNSEKTARAIRRGATVLFLAVAVPGGWPLTVPFTIADTIFVGGVNLIERYLRWNQKHEAKVLTQRGAVTPLVELVNNRDVDFRRIGHNGLSNDLIQEARAVRREFKRRSY